MHKLTCRHMFCAQSAEFSSWELVCDSDWEGAVRSGEFIGGGTVEHEATCPIHADL